MDTFGNLDDHAPQDVVVRNTRAYIMLLLGDFLFGDKLGFRDHLRWLLLLHDFHCTGSLSWASTMLAVVYCGLC